MNYLEQIVAFNRWKEVNPLSASEISLWYELMSICNKAGWPQEFTVPNGTLQSHAGLSRKQLDAARQNLIRDKLIEYKKSNRVNQAGRYKITPFVQKGQRMEHERHTDGTQEEHRRGTLSNKDKQKHKQKDNVPFSEIIDYLNQKTGSRYKASTQKTREHINARWGEGHRLDDFIKVIDVKTREWIDDPKMAKFLRPETLFGTKFEGYLNQGSAPPIDFEERRKQKEKMLFDMTVERNRWVDKHGTIDGFEEYWYSIAPIN